MKKVIALLLTACMMLGIMPLAMATGDESYDNNDESFNTELHYHDEDSIASLTDINSFNAPTCPICGAYSIRNGSTVTYQSIVGSSSVCYQIISKTPVYCASCGFHLYDETDILSTVAAHTWGPLNSDGYTRSCTTCGFTDRN